MTGVSDATERARLTRDEVEAMRREAARLLSARLRLVDAGENAVGESVLALADDWLALTAEFETAKRERADARQHMNDREAYLERRVYDLEGELGTFQPLRDRAEAAENRVAELQTILAELRPTEWVEYEAPVAEGGSCVNCGSREQTVVCADCGRLNPTEEKEGA